MPRSRSLHLETYDLEINKILSQLRKNREASNINIANQKHDENKVFRDYAMPSIDGATTSIQRPLK